jgi:hypothetical protein
MSAAWTPLAAPNITAASKNLRIATLRSNTLNLARSSLVNLNQSLSQRVIGKLFALARKTKRRGKFPRR